MHAVGSGVGTAVGAARQGVRLPVTGTARTESKLDTRRALGLDHGIVAPRDARAARVRGRDRRGTAARPTSSIDLVGGAYVTADVAAIAPGGRIVIVGTLAGGMPALPLLGLDEKRVAMHGTVLRPRSIAEKAAATDAFVARGRADARRRPGPARRRPVFPLDDASRTPTTLVASDTTFGKVILDAGCLSDRRSPLRR